MTVSLMVASQVGEDLAHLVKTLSAMRYHGQRVHPQVEASAYPVLFAVTGGPIRISTIADRIHSDVSTVSRQVSHLVRVGILEKVVDPGDGRAQLIALAPDGKQLVDDLHESRGQLFQALLAGWSTQEARELDDHLRRLRADLTTYITTNTAAQCAARNDAHTTDLGKESM